MEYIPRKSIVYGGYVVETYRQVESVIRHLMTLGTHKNDDLWLTIFLKKLYSAMLNRGSSFRYEFSGRSGFLSHAVFEITHLEILPGTYILRIDHPVHQILTQHHLSEVLHLRRSVMKHEILIDLFSSQGKVLFDLTSAVLNLNMALMLDREHIADPKNLGRALETYRTARFDHAYETGSAVGKGTENGYILHHQSRVLVTVWFDGVQYNQPWRVSNSYLVMTPDTLAQESPRTRLTIQSISTDKDVEVPIVDPFDDAHAKEILSKLMEVFSSVI